jgi:hypothetical protein
VKTLRDAAPGLSRRDGSKRGPGQSPSGVAKGIGLRGMRPTRFRVVTDERSAGLTVTFTGTRQPRVSGDWPASGRGESAKQHVETAGKALNPFTAGVVQ